MVNIISLVIAVVAAVVCYQQAKKNGRNPIGWGIFGFFFSLIALILVFVLGPKKS